VLDEWTDGAMASIAASAAAAERDPAVWGVVFDTVFPILGWIGFVLVGVAILMTLLDWGELSGLDTDAPGRAPKARTVAICGVVLGVIGLVGSIVR
jgi:hypothetical protein